jgi:hypothetical protein
VLTGDYRALSPGSEANGDHRPAKKAPPQRGFQVGGTPCQKGRLFLNGTRVRVMGYYSELGGAIALNHGARARHIQEVGS